VNAADVKPEIIDTHLARYQRIPFEKYDELRGSKGPRNRIYRVGVELEGGWSNLPPGVTLEHDGSVTVRQGRNAPLDPNFKHGELPSGILEPSKVEPFLMEFYPDHVNDSCGMHIHISLKSALHYQILMTPKFQATVLAYLKAWATKEGIDPAHRIWKRLTGQNQYCKLEYFADEQAQAPNKNYSGRNGGVASRYTAINYCHKQHGTVECRVLPMFDSKKQAVRAAKQVLDITNAFLAKHKQREEKFVSTIDIVEGVRDHLEEDIAPTRRASRQ